MIDPKFRAAIFDCDGTLADTMPAHYLAWVATMGRYGVSFPEDRFYAMGGMPTAKIIGVLSSEQGVTIDDIARVSLEKEHAFLTHLDGVRPLEAVVEIARWCRGKMPIAVASGGYRPFVTATLKQIGVLDWFDAVVTAEDTARHKPEPDVFLEAARRLGVGPQYCVVYEDTDIGLEAARRAGMASVDVRRLVTAQPPDGPAK